MLHNLIAALSKSSNSHKTDPLGGSEKDGELFTSIFKEALSVLESGAKSGKSLFNSLFMEATQPSKNSKSASNISPFVSKKLPQKALQTSENLPLLFPIATPKKGAKSSVSKAHNELKALIAQSKDSLKNKTLPPLAANQNKSNQAETVKNHKISDLFAIANKAKLRPTSITIEHYQSPKHQHLDKKLQKPITLVLPVDSKARNLAKSDKKEALHEAQETIKILKTPHKEKKSTSAIPTKLAPHAKEPQKAHIAQESTHKQTAPTKVQEIKIDNTQSVAQKELEAIVEQKPSIKPLSKRSGKAQNSLDSTDFVPKAHEKITDKPNQPSKNITSTPLFKEEKTPRQDDHTIHKNRHDRALQKQHLPTQESMKTAHESKIEPFLQKSENAPIQNNLAGILQLTKDSKTQESHEKIPHALSTAPAPKSKKKPQAESPSLKKSHDDKDSPLQTKKSQTTAQSLKTAMNQNQYNAPLRQEVEAVANEPVQTLAMHIHEKEKQKVKELENHEAKEKKSENSASSEQKNITHAMHNARSELIARNLLAKETLRNFTATLKEEIQNYKPPLTKLSLELNPEKLGNVELTITQRGQNLLVQVISNPQAIALFMNNNAEFRQQLANIGFNDVSMSFSDGGGGGGSFGGGFQQSHDQHEREKRNENGLSAYKTNALNGADSIDSALLSQMEIILPKYA